MVDEAVVRVTVAYSPAPREVREQPVELAAGSSVSAALRAAGISEGASDVGIWGRTTGLEAVVTDGDRIEIYRPLRVDPKVARRERFKKQGAKAAGLFASRRAGAKAGY
ncbi:MAG: RnfH family protein [Ramlibacter sp.]|nr:RnfH family protein [Ramlibacter sp.]